MERSKSILQIVLLIFVILLIAYNVYSGVMLCQVGVPGIVELKFQCDRTPTPTASPSPSVVKPYSLFDHAPDAVWSGNDPNNKLIPWMSWKYKIFSPAADVCNSELEDGKQYQKCIFTHPAWLDDGYVQGEFTMPAIGNGQHFLSKIGYAYGAQSTTDRGPGSGVNVYVYFRNDLVYQTVKYYDDSLANISVDLGRYVGQPGNLVIKVDANGSSGRDWFCWADPRVDVP